MSSANSIQLQSETVPMNGYLGGGNETVVFPLPKPNSAAIKSFILRLLLDIQERFIAHLNVIIESEAFKALEARWRALQELVWHKGNAHSVKIKVLDLSWEELAEDLHYAGDVRRSALAQVLGKRELDTLGGEPYGLLVVDHSLTFDLQGDYDDIYTAELLCDLGATSMCPIIMNVAEDFLGESDAQWYTDTKRIKNILQSNEYSSWKRLRESSNARFLGLALPHCQIRGRYEDLDLDSGFRFHQRPTDSSGLWGGAATCFAQTAISEFSERAWFGFLKLITNEFGSGSVLAPHAAPAPQGTTSTLRSRVRFTRAVSRFYSEEGFIPLAESTKTNQLYFVGNRSVVNCAGVPQKEVLTQLQSVMIACRLVHYIKIQIRNLIGSTNTIKDCETRLNKFLQTYTSTASMYTSELQSRYPLRSARVEVSGDTLVDTRFRCKIFIEPQYQIDHVLGEICLETDLQIPRGVAA